MIIFWKKEIIIGLGHQEGLQAKFYFFNWLVITGVFDL